VAWPLARTDASSKRVALAFLVLERSGACSIEDTVNELRKAFSKPAPQDRHALLASLPATASETEDEVTRLRRRNHELEDRLLQRDFGNSYGQID
jgi:hypothetical protein